jgi:S1-C subfamily serine protease
MQERGVGTGVVIVDNGTILTNLHVVLGAERIKVTFMDGTGDRRPVISVMPEHDLAVLRARRSPTTCSRHDARHRRPAPGDR